MDPRHANARPEGQRLASRAARQPSADDAKDSLQALIVAGLLLTAGGAMLFVAQNPPIPESEEGNRQGARATLRAQDGRPEMAERSHCLSCDRQYVDPGAGRVLFRDYAEGWRAAQVHRPSCQAHVETMLRRHAYPFLGDRTLASVLPSEIQAWVKRLSLEGGIAPSTIGVVHGLVSSAFKAPFVIAV